MTLHPLPDRSDGIRVLRAEGEIDVVTVPPLLDAGSALVLGATGLVLDLSVVTFFDSSGVRLVDQLAREASRAGAGYRVVAPAGSTARRVLELVGLAAPLAEDDLESAVAAIRR